jgi:tetratricopeptide (TPR) repeat protein
MKTAMMPSQRIFVLAVSLIALLISTAGIAAAGGPPLQEEGQEYVVQAGDWLTTLAERYYGDTMAWPVIWQATNARSAKDGSFAVIINPNILEVGQKLWIPGGAEKADYERLIARELNSFDVADFVNRGIALDDAGDFDGAIASYDLAIARNPYSAAAHTDRGAARHNLGDLAGAVADYDLAIALNPNLAEAYVNRGIARSNLDDSVGAIKDYSRAITLRPGYAEAYLGRGNARADSHDLDGAIGDYSQAIMLNPTYADAYWARGSVYALLGDHKSALVDLRHYLELDPNAGVWRRNYVGVVSREAAEQSGQ